jgi:hypothetical protein
MGGKCDFPRMDIIRKDIDGGERPVEAQGRRITPQPKMDSLWENSNTPWRDKTRP